MRNWAKYNSLVGLLQQLVLTVILTQLETNTTPSREHHSQLEFKIRAWRQRASKLLTLHSCGQLAALSQVAYSALKDTSYKDIQSRASKFI